MPYDSDSSDRIKAAKEDIDCYGGPGAGRGKSKTGNSPRPDIRGDARPHTYNPKTDDGM